MGKGQNEKPRTRVKPYSLAIIPLILLAALLYFVPPNLIGLMPEAEVPIESLTFERVILESNLIKVEVVNGGPNDITLSQLFINDALYSGYIDPDDVVPRLGRATLYIPYSWVKGEPIIITLLSSNAIKFEHEIEAAVATPVVGANQLITFALIGTYVGIIPVFLGLAWLPLLRKLITKWYNFILSLTVGLLIFLGADALIEASEAALSVPSAFQGSAVLIFGVAISFLGLQLIGERGFRGSSKCGKLGLLGLAYMIALGIGLHNFGEGLAIGSAYALGEVALGTFLILGFTIHNITEGVAIVSPVSRRSVQISHLVMLGLIGGAPTILGTIVGGMAYTSFWATLFLAVGVGAIFQVVYQISNHAIGGGIRGWTTPTNLAGLFLGLLIMYTTGMVIPT